MPLFFLLSGFSCTLGYGRTNYDRNGYECCKKEKDSKTTFDIKNYLFGRISRILPVYYFCFLASLPLIPLGHSYFAPNDYFHTIGGSFASMGLIQTWLLIFWFGSNGPSWTVSTLFFFYLMYPW